MEKLIELLNQFEEEKKSDNRWGLTYIDNELMGLSNIREARLAVISKEYGFIKWLLDNDKIDRDKIIEKSDFMPIVSNKVGDFFQPTEEQELLMLLSIQDSPIDFLISILKDKKVRTVYVDKDGNVSGDTKRYTDC